MFNRINSALVSSALYAVAAEKGAEGNTKDHKPSKDEQRIASLVDEAIRSSKEHGPKLKTAACAAFLAGILNGGWNEFNRLVKNVSEQDAEGIRFFVVNCTKRFGAIFEFKSGEKQGESTAQLMPVKYSRTNGYATQKASEIANVDEQEVSKAFASIRAKLKDTGEKGLMEIKFGPNRDTGTDDGGTVYDWQADFARAMERIASKGGPKARLEQAVKAAGIDANHKPNIEGKWKDTTKALEEARKAAEAAQKRVELLEKQAKEMPADPAE
jgi:hypothetical protein